MSICIGQISYLPDNHLRTKRFEASQFQIDFMHKLLPNAPITSVCQNYHDSECVFDYVNYVRFENGIGAGAARNVILEQFYKSDYDWLLLLDDDTVFYPYYNYENFIHEIENDEGKFRCIDAISSLEPEYHPYKKLNFEDRNNLTHYKFEPRELNSGSATSFIRNIRKYNDKTLYFPNVDANKGEGREDMEFLLAWLKEGFNWYTMQTLIRKSLCFDKSSIFGDDTKSRDKILMHDLDVICERYKDDGLQRQVNGKITWNAFNERYNKSEKVLYIPREVPIQYDEKTTPQQKQISKTLFDI